MGQLGGCQEFLQDRDMQAMVHRIYSFQLVAEVLATYFADSGLQL